MKQWWVLSVVAAGILVVVLGGLTWKHYHQPKPDPEKGAITISTTAPDETVPTPKAYPALPTGNQPERIVIPAIKIDNFVQRVGIDQAAQVAVPTNINLAGWFVRSSVPGEKGLSIIDGHLDGLHADGIFKHLASLRPGDVITITMENGTERIFTVMTVQTVANADAANLLFSQDPTVASQLNLITCGGVFDTTSKEYNQRVIVTAKLS